MGKREVSSLAWQLLHDVLKNNRSELDALCPAHLSYDTPKGAPPWKSFLGASASLHAFGSQTAILSHVPFYVKQQHIPFQFLLESLTSQPPSQRTPFWFLWEKNHTNEFCESVFNCSCQAMRINRKSVAPCATRLEPVTDKGFHSRPRVM